MRKLLNLALLLALAVLPARAFADEGWVIERFDVDIAIHKDGSFDVVEEIAVDFQGLEKHGIFREIPVLYEWEADQSKLRSIDINSVGVTDDRGAAIRWDVTTDNYLRLKIGDPNRTISGKQVYRIAYTVRGMLNPFADHDELYWNATGDQWPVPIEEASVRVNVPGGRIDRVACYMGPVGSTERCGLAKVDRALATFAAGRTLGSGEGLTFVASIPKGTVTVAAPTLQDREKTVGDALELHPAYLVVAGGTFLFVVAFLFARWYEKGRDKRYTSVYQLTGDEAEASAGAFQDETIVVEYEPPDNLRPAEIGVVIDERADTTDVSATIIDLAARGYLNITELEKKGWFGKTDYKLTKLKPAEAELEGYEQTIFDGLFDSGDEVELSDLKNKFYKDLKEAKKELYSRSVKLKHFARSPEKVRSTYVMWGVGLLVIGGGLSVLLGMFSNAGIVGFGAALGGIPVMLFAKAMPARTAKGREIYRRSLGFKKFIEVADKSRQEFYEQQGIFERYLPYAMMFGSVRKWAGVFEELGIEVPEPTYYHGNYTTFQAAAFASSFTGFSSSVGSVMASTPGGSGGSGFSGGGSSGGGGGGGGGGSW